MFRLGCAEANLGMELESNSRGVNCHYAASLGGPPVWLTHATPRNTQRQQIVDYDVAILRGCGGAQVCRFEGTRFPAFGAAHKRGARERADIQDTALLICPSQDALALKRYRPRVWHIPITHRRVFTVVSATPLTGRDSEIGVRQHRLAGSG